MISYVDIYVFFDICKRLISECIYVVLNNQKSCIVNCKIGFLERMHNESVF